MKAAVKVSPHKVKFFGSPWAAPAWMKTNNNLIHGGYLIGEPGGKYYKSFALYFVKYVLFDIFMIFVENFEKLMKFLNIKI